MPKKSESKNNKEIIYITISIIFVLAVIGFFYWNATRNNFKTKLSYETDKNDNIIVSVYVKGKDIAGIQGNLVYDKNILKFENAKGLHDFNVSVSEKHNYFLMDNIKGFSGEVKIAELTFKRLKKGSSIVKITDVKGANSEGNSLFEGASSKIEIK